MKVQARHWLVLGLVLALWAAFSAASYFLLVRPRQQRFDFYPRWVGARAALTGESPYSQDVTCRIQEGMFHRRLEPGQDQQRFAYSALITWLLFPFWLLPFPAAVSLWCGLQFALLLLMFPLLTALLGLSLRPLPFAVLLFFSVLVYRYPINAYVLGQFVMFVMACVVAGWWGVVHRRPYVTGLALFGLWVRPELAILPLMVLLIALWRTGQWPVIAIWATGTVFLWFLTRMWIGAWVGDFLSGIVAYADYSFPRWPPLVLGHIGIAIGVAVVAWGWWVWMMIQTRALAMSVRLRWRIAASVVVTLLVFPQTNNYTLVLGLLAAWVVLWAGGRRWPAWVLVLAVLALPWGFLLLSDRLPAGLDQLLIPMALGMALSLCWPAWRSRAGCEA